MSDLIPIEKINALQVFTKDGIGPLLDQIKAEVEDFEPDVSTAKGRAEIKSRAYKVILSKGVIDRAGAELVKSWKEQAAIVDSSRRKARKFLDQLSKEVRQPYTDYEEETARMKAEAVHKAAVRQAHFEALAEHDVWLREKALAEKEAKIRAEEEERQRIEDERKKTEKLRLEKERIREEAEDKAKKAGSEKIRLAGLRTQKAVADKKLLVETAKREKREAAEKAEKEKKEAVEAERLRLLNAQKERERVAEEQAEGKRKADADRQANAEHRREINVSALEALMENGFNSVAAKKFITVVFQEKIPGIRMVY